MEINWLTGVVGYLLCGYLWAFGVYRANPTMDTFYSGISWLLWPLGVAGTILYVLWHACKLGMHLLGYLVQRWAPTTASRPPRY